MSEEKPYWEGKKYSFFSHKECEYFPCHKTNDPENFNCTEKGVKDCTDCLLPHKRKNFGYIMSKYNEIMELAKTNREK